MVNLEEILESEKKPYTCPVMVVKRIDFSDILTTSGDGKTPEDGTPGAFTDPNDPSNPGVELGE